MKAYEIEKKDVNNARDALKKLCKKLNGKIEDNSYSQMFGDGLIGEASVKIEEHAKPDSLIIEIYSVFDNGIELVKKALKKNKVNLGNLVEERI